MARRIGIPEQVNDLLVQNRIVSADELNAITEVVVRFTPNSLPEIIVKRFPEANVIDGLVAELGGFYLVPPGEETSNG